MQSSKKYLVKTVGCKANLFDSQQIEMELQKNGWQPIEQGSLENPDICIINSCTVTDEADKQSRKLASKLFKKNPDTKVIMTGCSAEVDPEKLSQSSGVHFVIGNRDKSKMVHLIEKALSENQAKESSKILGVASGYEELVSRHPMDREWPVVESSLDLKIPMQESRKRAFLKIQDGCNSFCTYCIIPYGRGPARSLKPSDIVDQIKKLESLGFQEVVLTGINLGDFGVDFKSETFLLHHLAEKILNETSIARIRFGSLDPVEITDELLMLMTQSSRLCAHFHVSLQSAHNQILKLMKRKYTVKDVENTLKKLQKLQPFGKNIFVGMDVITGFPGETDEIFEESFELLKKLYWSRLHVFPYSERKGTPATKLKAKVPENIRTERALRLRDLSLERMKSFVLQSVQEGLSELLVEGSCKGPGMHQKWVSGYTSNYIRCLLATQNPSELSNQFIKDLPSFSEKEIRNRLFIDRAGGEVSFLLSV